MNAQRFQNLAEAYGADLRHWPEAERGAARAFMDADPHGAERLLFEARQMDLVLEASSRAVVSHDLRERVIALAATAGLKPRARFAFGRLAWASGAGWAVACVAGVLVGLNLFAVAAGVTVWVTREVAEERVEDARSSRVRVPLMEVIDTIEPARREPVRAELRAAALSARPDFHEAREARRQAIA